MTNKKITDFPDGPGITGNEYVPVAVETANYKYSLNQFRTWVQQNFQLAWGQISGNLSSQTDLNNALALKAPLISPAFTSTPTAPTAPNTTATTQLATTAYVDNRLKAYQTFRARKSGTQSVASGGANVVLSFNTADWNVGTAYSTGTNRFTPTIAGYYFVSATAAAVPSAGTLTSWQLAVLKNGSVELYGDYVGLGGQLSASSNVSGLVLLNGTTDFVTIGGNAVTSGGAAATVQATTETYFAATLMVPS